MEDKKTEINHWENITDTEEESIVMNIYNLYLFIVPMTNCREYILFLIGTTGVSRRPALFDMFKSKQKTDTKKQPSIMKQVKAAVQVIITSNNC